MANILPIPEIPVRENWDIESAREALHEGLLLSLGQSWLQITEPEFQSGFVKVGYSGNHLVILAELEDQWIHNPETQKNKPAFLRGDTFEIFLKADHREDYWELHVTPDNVVMQLHFPRHIGILLRDAKSKGEAFGTNPFLVWEAAFASQVSIQPNSWTVLAEIPLDIFGENGRHVSLQANFARYDYPPGSENPILSATATLGQPPNFHTQSGWSRLKAEVEVNP